MRNGNMLLCRGRPQAVLDWIDWLMWLTDSSCWSSRLRVNDDVMVPYQTHEIALLLDEIDVAEFGPLNRK